MPKVNPHLSHFLLVDSQRLAVAIAAALAAIEVDKKGKGREIRVPSPSPRSESRSASEESSMSENENDSGDGSSTTNSSRSSNDSKPPILEKDDLDHLRVSNVYCLRIFQLVIYASYRSCYRTKLKFLSMMANCRIWRLTRPLPGRVKERPFAGD